MGYSDPKFYSRKQTLMGAALSLSTATASGAIANSDVAALPKFIRRSQVNNFELVVRTIPNAASTALKVSILNGTNTIGTAILTTATLGQTVSGVVTSTTNNIFAAGTSATANLAGTATASAAANGAYDFIFEVQELYS
jgi:hypothetical protein